jgi:hypothetical protein
MPSRYQNSQTAINDHKLYKDLFNKRGVKFIKQFRNSPIQYPKVKDLVDLSVIAHVWALGDRYFKLAYKHYGDEELWWVIAWYNQKPTEFHIVNGDIIEIPFPLEQVLALYGL